MNKRITDVGPNVLRNANNDCKAGNKYAVMKLPKLIVETFTDVTRVFKIF